MGRIHEVHEAVEMGDVEGVSGWLDGGGNINERSIATGRTILHWAVDANRPEFVELLLGRGADVNARDSSGWTPLYIAAMEGYIEFVELLLDGGADVNARSNNGWTPLCVAKAEGYTNIVELLHSKGGVE